VVLVLLFWSWSYEFGLVYITARPHSWWGLLTLPKNPTPLWAFGLDFRPFGPHSAACSNSLHFPQCIGVLINALVVPIFADEECIRMQVFVFKMYKHNPGIATPGPPRRKGRHLFTPLPCPPARCWCPSASYRMATALCVTLKISWRQLISKKN